jgi:hypothetical protein
VFCLCACSPFEHESLHEFWGNVAGWLGSLLFAFLPSSEKCRLGVAIYGILPRFHNGLEMGDVLLALHHKSYVRIIIIAWLELKKTDVEPLSSTLYNYGTTAITACEIFEQTLTYLHGRLSLLHVFRASTDLDL